LTAALVSIYQQDLGKDHAMGDKSPKNKTKKQKAQKKAAAAPPKPAPKK
jgi:hypothetical protein